MSARHQERPSVRPPARGRARGRACLRSLLCAAALASAAAPTWAGTWLFASDTPLLLGGALSGAFEGSDIDADGTLQALELFSFVAAYSGAEPATSSFAIDAFAPGDQFSYGLATGDLSFSVSDTLNRSINGGTSAFSSVVGIDFVDAGGSLLVSAVPAVPEPASASLLLGGVGLMVMRWRCRRGDARR